MCFQIKNFKLHSSANGVLAVKFANYWNILENSDENHITIFLHILIIIKNPIFYQ